MGEKSKRRVEGLSFRKAWKEYLRDEGYGLRSQDITLGPSEYFALAPHTGQPGIWYKEWLGDSWCSRALTEEEQSAKKWSVGTSKKRARKLSRRKASAEEGLSAKGEE